MDRFAIDPSRGPRVDVPRRAAAALILSRQHFASLMSLPDYVAAVEVVTNDMIAPGALVAAVGADNAEKSEPTPALMAGAKVVVDLIDQAATMGDLRHAIAAGVMTREHVLAELSDVVFGRKAGRTSDVERIVFDSTGTAIQAVATAVAIWKSAVSKGVGATIDFGALQSA